MRVVNGYEVKPGANLSGADLRDADLSGADLRGAVLREAVLREASLRGADLRGAELSGVDLSGAGFSWARLSGADLTDCKGLPEIEAFPLDVVLLEELETGAGIGAAFGKACEQHPQSKELENSYGWYTARYLIDNACSIRYRVFSDTGKYGVTEEDVKLYVCMYGGGWDARRLGGGLCLWEIFIEIVGDRCGLLNT